MKTPTKLFKLVLCTSIIILSQAVQAQVLFSSPVGNFDMGLFTNSTVGARFTVGSQPIQVNFLGVYDSLQDGLIENHQVGIWGSSGLITSSIVPSGTGAPLFGTYRYVPISAVTLLANTAYAIGAFFDIVNTGTGYDPIGVGGTSAVDPAISSATPNAYSGNNNPVFTEPLFFFAADTLWAANMRFTVVPEPSTFALVTMFGLVAFFRRRR